MPTAERLKINEIFHSVQGEGTRVGMRCAFIRLTGCHLRCTYCDTEYAFYEGGWMSLDEVLKRVRVFQAPAVEVTGGEPLLQPAVYPLLARLLDEYATVLLETSGAISIERVDPRVVRIVDFKCPSSGEAENNCWKNVELLTPSDEVKFVIGTREDYDWSRGVVERNALARRCPVIFSPVTPCPGADQLMLGKGGLEAAQLAQWVLDDRLNVRIGLQLHRLIWSPLMRGV
jgi:7-carboxy-7-deazaguanine synthase